LTPGRSFFEGEPLILAHRGASAYAPDHSLTAIRRALADGADAIEADVHVTADGHPVLHHGGDVSENTEARGPVHGYSLAELRALDAGHRWSPDGGATFPFRGRGERILTVAEALEAFPDARFSLDVKVHAAARPTRRVIDEHYAWDRVLLASWFSWRRRPALRGYPGARSITLDQMLAFMFLHWARLDALWTPPVDALQIPERYYGIPLMTPRLVRRAAAHGIRVHVWTVNDEADMVRLLSWGVKGLVTDRPDLAVRVRARYLAERGAI
jgi:glycerophosphoryl diester phosphodiesterase